MAKASRAVLRVARPRNKGRRKRLIATILRRRDVGSQADLAELLRAAGERVTQATLSRDLEELGAYKVRLPDGGAAYRVPEDPPSNGDWLQRMLSEFVLEIEHSGNLVVVKTPPGGASPVARALDSASVPGVIGTVAGDDTILVVAREGAGGAAVASRLRRLTGHAGAREA
jgi:transcriptional regulator of arginine metabolism